MQITCMSHAVYKVHRTGTQTVVSVCLPLLMLVWFGCHHQQFCFLASDCAVVMHNLGQFCNLYSIKIRMFFFFFLKKSVFSSIAFTPRGSSRLILLVS